MVECVLGVLPRLSDGGAERALIRVLNDQALRRKTCLVVFKAGGVLKELVSSDVEIFELDSIVPPIARLFCLLVKLKPRVVFSTFGDVNVLLSFLKKFSFLNYRLVLREPACPEKVFENSRIGWLLNSLYPAAYGWADYIVVLSLANKRKLVSILGEGRGDVRLIGNVPGNRCKSPKLTGLEGQYFVSVGRLVEQKGFDLLVLAFMEFIRAGHNYSLYIIGEGPSRCLLEELIRDCGLEERVVLLGQMENPFAVVSGASAYVLSSRYEGVSNSMLEALMLGVPVIATTESTSADEYVVDGESGVLIPTTDTEGLLAGMVKFTKGHVATSGAGIREMYSGRLNEEKMLSLYDELLTRSVIDG